MKSELENLYILKESFFNKKFPNGVAGTKIKGIELVLLDSYCAGLIGKVLGYNDQRKKGILTPDEYSNLCELSEELNLVLPELKGISKEHFQLLHQVVTQTILFVDQNR